MLMEEALGQTSGPFFLDDFSVVDCVFLPYVERMNASLFYYKGFTLRDPRVFPRITAWFQGLESRPSYRGTQSDFHTHCHDLPPQMGGKGITVIKNFPIFAARFSAKDKAIFQETTMKTGSF